MKRTINRLISTVLVFIIMVTCTSNIFAYDTLITDIDSVIKENYYMENYIGYQYPILPGTKEWRALKDHQQMVDACQIPEEIYQNMTTEELAQSIIAYPLNIDMFAYDSYELGYSVVKEHFVALEEFSKRSDSASCLIDLAIKQKPVYTKDLDAETLRAFNSDNAIITTAIGKKACKQIFNNLTYSLLLSMEDFTTKMTKDEKSKLANVSKKYASALQTTQDLENLYTPRVITPVAFYDIYDIYTTTYTPISTPKGGSMIGFFTEVQEIWLCDDNNYYIFTLPELSNAAKTVKTNENYDVYGIMPISDPTITYNCHSYAWYSQTNCNYWVNTPNTTGYTLVDKLTVNVGGKMLYYGSFDGSYTTLTHSAVITDIEYHPRSRVTFTVKSKWGAEGLYEHYWSNCPYYYHDADGNHNINPNDIKLYNS